MRVRTIIGSTAIHAGLLGGLGVWAGAFAGVEVRPIVQFQIVLDDPTEAWPQTEPRDFPIEVEPRPDDSLPLTEPMMPPPDATVFEAPAARAEFDMPPDLRPVVDPWVRVRPPTPDPVEQPTREPAADPAPPLAFVDAEALDEINRPPEYPPVSVQLGEVGEVLLRLAIDATGRVTKVTLEQGCHFPRLHVAAIAAARQWQFAPARRHGVVVATEKLIPVEFRIR